MSDIDLSTLSLEELKSLNKDVTKAIATFEKRKLKEARAAAEAAANELGFSLDELLDTKSKGKTRTPKAAKYRHPENPAVTWSGRGRRPAWFKEAIKAGQSPEDLEIAA